MLPMPAVDDIAAPFMNQIAMLPDVSRQRISLLRSPSKSPVSATDHVVGTLPTEAVVIGMLLRPIPKNQIARLPEESRHSTSVMPSPSKSPVPAIDQIEGTLPRE